MIIAKTKMEKMPKTCADCKYKTTLGYSYVCSIANHVIQCNLGSNRGFVIGRELFCPLMEVQDDYIKNEDE